jgi:hypothetical protein
MPIKAWEIERKKENEKVVFGDLIFFKREKTKENVR